MILILSIISVGMLPMIKSDKVADKFQITNQRINTIYRSLSSFVAINGRLPCPALLSIAKGDAGYGNETATPGTCTAAFTSTSATNLAYGMIPVSALNLPIELAEDGWGNKFEYIVDKRFTTRTKDENDNQGFEYQQTLTYPGGPALSAIINIYDGATVSNSTALFVILSHGANGYKAWPSDATTQNTTSGTNPDEPKNSRDENTNNFDNSFYASSATINTNFDDILLYKTKQQLVQDAGMEFIRCSALDGQLQYPFTSTTDKTTWGDCNVAATANFKTMIQGATGSYNCPTGCTNGQPSLTMTRTCDKYGSWVGSVGNSCKSLVILCSGTPCPEWNRIFFTSTYYRPTELKGSAADPIAGADQICTDRANAAGLGGGPWKAWISTSYSQIKDRITVKNKPYKYLNGYTAANDFADLTDGSINYGVMNGVVSSWTTENGVSRQYFDFQNIYYIWTGSNHNGSYSWDTNSDPWNIYDNCSDWTVDTGTWQYLGNYTYTNCSAAGLTNHSSTAWTKATCLGCGQQHGRLYCFEDRP